MTTTATDLPNLDSTSTTYVLTQTDGYVAAPTILLLSSTTGVIESSDTALETGLALTGTVALSGQPASSTRISSSTTPLKTPSTTVTGVGYPSADGAGATTPTDQVKAHSNASPSVGAIAGGVVGGVIGLAAIAAIVFFLMRRKRRQMRTQLPEMQRYPVRDRGASSEMERVL